MVGVILFPCPNVLACSLNTDQVSYKTEKGLFIQLLSGMLSLLNSAHEFVYVVYLKELGTTVVGWWSMELAKNVKNLERVSLKYGRIL